MTQAREILRHAVIVAGPTCSGKSALAIDLARALNGVIINADSMQLYRELAVVTARPSQQDEMAAPHRLYGVLPAATAGSVAWWRAQALAEMDAAWGAGKLPVLCGGTGMYFRALTHGLAEIPDPGEEARTEARTLVAQEGPQSVHARLMQIDPDTAAVIRPADSQRLSRAWEVWRGTGRGLAWWRAQPPGLAPVPCSFTAIRLAPARERLRAAITTRFDAMIGHGALDEVSALLAQGLPASLPAMRAVGVSELSAVLRGEMDLGEASRLAVLATGQYIKRQDTWFSRQPLALPQNTRVFDRRWGEFEKFSERYEEEIVTFVRGRIDAAPGFP